MAAIVAVLVRELVHSAGLDLCRRQIFGSINYGRARGALQSLTMLRRDKEGGRDGYQLPPCPLTVLSPLAGLGSPEEELSLLASIEPRSKVALKLMMLFVATLPIDPTACRAYSYQTYRKRPRSLSSALEGPSNGQINDSA